MNQNIAFLQGGIKFTKFIQLVISPSWDPFGDTEFIVAGLIQWSTYVAMYIWV